MRSDGRFPAGGLGALAGGGLVAWAAAGAGYPVAGAAAWLLGTAVGLGLLKSAWGARPRCLSDLIESVRRDPVHPQAPVVEDVRGLVSRVDVHGQAIRDVVRKLQEHATLVAWVIDTLNQATTEARESLSSMQEATGRVGDHAAEVLAASQRGVAFIEAMGTSTEDLFRSAETLNRSVEDATASVVQIHGAISGVEEGVGLLSDASDRTTEFISQVGQAMGGIRERTDHSLDLAQKVEDYARRGREVVVGVGGGVDAIRKSSEAMVQSVQALGRQSQEIEGVLSIITDVAEETSLLSLNAAILAAQAGEKGAAFGVVADQIRSLAQRTRESTKHIEELIRGIQANITEANLGLTANLEAVEEGGELGREAVRQLELIERAVAESVEQASQIAEAAQEQDEKSTAMVSAAGEVNENLHQVAENLRQSLQEMGRIQDLIQSLSALSQSVRGATDEHREIGWKTAELMGSFSTQMEGIRALIDQQHSKSSSLEDALGQVAESSESTRESLETIHSIVNEMVRQSDGLREEMGQMLGAAEEEEETEEEADVA